MDVLRNSPGRVYLLLTAIVGVVVLYDAVVARLVTYALYADYWEHSATLTAWLRDLWNPANPHVADPSGTPRFMPWFMVLASLGQVLPLTSPDLLAISSVSNYILICIGIWLFFPAYFRDDWAAPVAFVVLFCAWGASWNWSNLYQFRSFLYVASYPSSFVFGLSLIAFWLSLKLLREELRFGIGLPVLALLAGLSFLCHPLTGVFAIVGCGLLALTDGRVSLVQRLLLMAMLPAGMLLAELWPFFSPWGVATGASDAAAVLADSSDTQWGGAEQLTGMARFHARAWYYFPFYDQRQFVWLMGFALLGAPIVAWLAIIRRKGFIVLGALVMTLPFLLNFFVMLPLAHRFILFTAFFFHMAMVWLVLEAWLGGRNPVLRWSTSAVLAVMVVWNVWLAAIEFEGKTFGIEQRVVDKRAILPGDLSVVELYDRLTRGMEADTVVMAPADLAWPLPTVRGKVVSLFHVNPLVADRDLRTRDVQRFFGPDTGTDERFELLDKYAAAHVLVRSDATPEPFMSWLAGNGEVTAEEGVFRMYRLSPPVPEVEPEVVPEADPEAVSPVG